MAGAPGARRSKAIPIWIAGGHRAGLIGELGEEKLANGGLLRIEKASPAVQGGRTTTTNDRTPHLTVSVLWTTIG